MSTPLPAATDDLEQARDDLQTHGCAFVSNALSQDELRALRKRLVDQAAGERKAGVATIEPPNNQRVWNLISKGQEFRELVLNPPIHELVRSLIGEDFTLGNCTANITAPGGDVMGLHSDQFFMPADLGFPISVQVMWMLDDFTEANGATRVVPRSHTRTDEAWLTGSPRDDVTWVPAEGAAGTALVFDARLWHGTGANRTKDQVRHGILTYFCRPYIRPQENFTLSTHPALLRDASPELLTLLGFRAWGTFGSIQGAVSMSDLADLDASLIGAMNAQGEAIDSLPEVKVLRMAP